MSEFRSYRKRYIPDLKNDGAVCEGNFAKLQRIFPGMKEDGRMELELHDGSRRFAHIRLAVRERFSYTSTVTLEVKSTAFSSRKIVIRVYEDARMAEVVKPDSGKQLSGVYPYPNEQMYQVDEKAQLNQFVAECLNHCLSHGHLVDTRVLDRLFSQM